MIIPSVRLLSGSLASRMNGAKLGILTYSVQYRSVSILVVFVTTKVECYL